MKLLRLSSSLILQKMKEENISQLDDYDPPFCEQQYTHRSCYISLFKFKSFDKLIPPKLPQMIPGQLIALGQLTDPGVNFASLHGLTPKTVHMSFSLPRGNFVRQVVQHRVTHLSEVTFLHVNRKQKLPRGKSSLAHAHY